MLDNDSGGKLTIGHENFEESCEYGWPVERSCGGASFTFDLGFRSCFRSVKCSKRRTRRSDLAYGTIGIVSP